MILSDIRTQLPQQCMLGNRQAVAESKVVAFRVVEVIL